MPCSMGMLVNDSKTTPKATSIAPTQTILENSVVITMPNAATLSKRCSMKSTTVNMRSRRNILAKKKPMSSNASAPPQGSSITPNIPSSYAAPAPPSIMAPPNQVAMTVIEHNQIGIPRPATMNSVTEWVLLDA